MRPCHILEYLDLVLIMTVEPGFGGQSFMRDMLNKLRGVRALIDQYRPGCEVEVDGGIDASTAPLVVDSGASVLVAAARCLARPTGPQLWRSCAWPPM